MNLARLRRKADEHADPARTTGRVDRGFDRAGKGIDYYGGVLIGVETIAERALDPAVMDELLSELGGLDEDDYLRYVQAFVAEGRRTAGSRWRYADIVTVLAAAAELVQPRSYLEIGVRRGRSMSVVARRAPDSAIIGVDRWDEGYANMENPGPDLVRSELERAGFRGSLEFVSGNSHDVLPSLFFERPELDFDLITVDGDHSPEGAAADLRDVIPRLRIGGVLVFDDIGHPTHPELNDVWQGVVASDRAFRTWEFDDVGYGVAAAVRRW